MAKRAKRDGIYKRKDRPGFWISWSDAQGRRRRRKTDAQTAHQARSALSAELVKVEQARVIGFTPPGEETFAAVAQRFLVHQKVRLTPRAYEREKGIVEAHLIPFFACKLSAVRRVDVQRYVTKRSADVSAHSIQKELNVFKHLLNLAVEWEIVPFNPAQGVKSPRVPAGRVRYLQPTELRVVLGACHEWLRPIVALAVSTGMRRGEILGLRWLDVDMLHDRIMLPQTKNGEGRIVYLNKSAQAVIQSLPFNAYTKTSERLFRDVTPGQVTVTFKRVCNAVGVSDFRFHDLRHTAASWLRMQGADIHTVAQLLGHKDLRMAARYQHLSPTFLADAVGRLDAVFGDLSHHSVTAPKVLPAFAAVTN
jgi:site-specific recombinase XerD